MNTANKLTILRILITPVFFAVLCIPFPHRHIPALLLFIGAAITDGMDGSIARKRGIVTDFGKFLDPLADKMLTTAAYLAFIYLGYGFGIVAVTFIILTREFLIMSLRLVSVGNGLVISAGFAAKLKTVFQMIAIITIIVMEYAIWLFLGGFPPICFWIRVAYSVILWFTVVLAVVSGVQYFYQNKNQIDYKT